MLVKLLGWFGLSLYLNPLLFLLPVRKMKLDKPVVITIASVGDVFIHKSVLDAVYEPENKTYNFFSPFAEIAPDLQDADLATAWFGGALDTVGPYTGYPVFKTPSTLASALKQAGFDILFRTNHTLDDGERGLQSTCAILKKYGISQVGAYGSEEESRNIFVYEKGSLRVAFLSYTYGTNGIPIPRPWMVNLIDTDKIKTEIKKAKAFADFVIVALHFGTEYERNPNREQRRIVTCLADNGADFIIGSHPHVLQPVECLTLPCGKRVYVAYSLGNFFCGQRMRFTDTGVILKYQIVKRKGRAELASITYRPVWIAKYQVAGRYRFQILPIKKALALYQDGKLPYLTSAHVQRMKEAHQETVSHINNPEIGFTEYNSLP